MTTDGEIARVLSRLAANTQALLRYGLSGFVALGLLWVLDSDAVTKTCPQGQTTQTTWILVLVGLVFGFLLYGLHTASYNHVLFRREIRKACQKLLSEEEEFARIPETTNEARRTKLSNELPKTYLSPSALDIARWRRRQGNDEQRAIQRGLDDWNSLGHFIFTTALALVLVPLLLLICRWEQVNWKYMLPMIIGAALYWLETENFIRATMRELMVLSREQHDCGEPATDRENFSTPSTSGSKADPPSEEPRTKADG